MPLPTPDKLRDLSRDALIAVILVMQTFFRTAIYLGHRRDELAALDNANSCPFVTACPLSV